MKNTIPFTDFIGKLKQEIPGNFPCKRTLKIVSDKNVLIKGEIFETVDYGSTKFIVRGSQSLKLILGNGQHASITAESMDTKTPLKIFHDRKSVTAAKKIIQFYSEEGQPISFFNDYYDGYSIDGYRNVSAISVSITRE